MRDSVREQGQGALDASAKRLERALGALETRFDRRLKRIEQLEAARGGEGAAERTRLIAELDAVRARERALEAIAAEASAALGRAAEEVRAALADPITYEEGEPDVVADRAADSAPESELESDLGGGLEGEDGPDVFLPQAAKG